METAAANWRWDQLHDEKFHDGSFKSWSPTRSKLHPYAHRDGVTIVASEVDFNPDDDFLATSTPQEPTDDGSAAGD